MTATAWVRESWGREAVTARRLARTRARRKLLRKVALALAPLVLAGSSWLAVTAMLSAPVARSDGVSLWRTSSGLLLSVPFDRAVPLRDLGDTFAFGGSAAAGVGFAVARERGLAIGVQRHAARFEGWFAVTRAAFPAAGVYHVAMSKPSGELRSRGAQGEAVFAVQTGTTKVTGLINYVIVASNSHGGTTAWSIGYATGHIANARLHRFLRLPVPPTSPDTRDVTVETDGRRRLAVWFGTRMVFDSRRLRLDVAPPFQAYLEVQSRSVPYVSSFRNFWVTSSSTISVSAPHGTQLRLVALDGEILAATTVRSGDARLALPPPRAQGTADLIVRLRGRSVRIGPFEYSGGDRYRLSGLGPNRPGGVKP